MSIKITDRYFKYGGHKYFRVSAHETGMGSYGQKRVPLGKVGYLEVAGRIAPRHLADERITTTVVGIDWEQVTQADIGLSGQLNYLGVGINSSHNFTLDAARSAHLKLVSFSIDENPLTRVLNREANFVRRQMEEEGNDARVVSKIWVVMEAELAEDIGTGTLNSSEVDYAGASLKLDIQGSSRRRSTVTLEPGTTFAYRLSKVTKWNRGHTVIEDMKLDYAD